MRRVLIYMTKLMHGFFFLSMFYCFIIQLFIKNTEGLFSSSLLLLPVLLICSMAVKKVKGVISYVLVSGILIAAVLALANYIGMPAFDKMIWLALTIFVIVSYFFARAGKKECWLEAPSYWFLIFYLLICIYGTYNKSEFLIRLASVYAGLDYLVTQVYVNAQKMSHFIKDYSNLERLPVQRMIRNNNYMVVLQSFFTAAAMMAAPYLQIDRLIINIGKLLRAVLIWILHFFAGREEAEPISQVVEQAAEQFGFGAVEGEESIWLLIIEKILQFIGWVLLISFVLAALFLLIRKIIRIYNQFNDHVEENGDIVESIRLKKEDKVNVRHEIRESLFFNLSPDARIRKHYKKKIQKENKEEIKDSWTPRQLEEAVILSEEKKEKFHRYYEKARYSKESCTKEEMQEMIEY